MLCVFSCTSFKPNQALLTFDVAFFLQAYLNLSHFVIVACMFWFFPLFSSNFMAVHFLDVYSICFAFQLLYNL